MWVVHTSFGVCPKTLGSSSLPSFSLRSLTHQQSASVLPSKYIQNAITSPSRDGPTTLTQALASLTLIPAEASSQVSASTQESGRPC